MNHIPWKLSNSADPQEHGSQRADVRLFISILIFVIGEKPGRSQR